MSKKNSKIRLNSAELSNSFNTLAANIRFASIDSNVKSITIVSTAMNEGKTTVAINLGKALVAAKKTCLLVDCDMRKRSISTYINVHPKYGLISLLSGKCSIYEAISQTHIPGLYFLDCEPNIPSPVDVISTNMFASLIDCLHEKFDYIIFDTPPLGSFVDGAMIAALTDATILTIRQKSTKRTDIENVLEQLDAAKVRVLGSVLTFSKNAKSAQYYYAYYNKDGKRVKKDNQSESPLNSDQLSDDTIRKNLSTWYDGNNAGYAVSRQKSMTNNAGFVDNHSSKHAKSSHVKDNAGNFNNTSNNANTDSNINSKSSAQETSNFKAVK